MKKLTANLYFRPMELHKWYSKHKIQPIFLYIIRNIKIKPSVLLKGVSAGNCKWVEIGSIAKCQSVIRMTLKVNGKALNSTPAIRKRPHRRLPKLARVTTSEISTPVQNCIKKFCPSPHMRNCLSNVHSASFYWGWFFQLATLGRCADFDDYYVERRRFAQGFAFWGSRKRNLTFYPIFPNREIFGRLSMGLRKFRLKTGFNMGTSSVNTPKTTSYAFGS